MSESTQIYITDATGRKWFNTCCSVEFKAPVLRDMRRQLEQAAKYPKHYEWLHLASARIVDESAQDDITDSQLLDALGWIA